HREGRWQAAGRAERALRGGARVVIRTNGFVSGPGPVVADRPAPPEQRSLPILQTTSPRLREPTELGSVGAKRRAEQPVYVPQPLHTRPHAVEIARWMDYLENTSLLEMGARADALRRQKHPEGIVSYIVDRNINR